MSANQHIDLENSISLRVHFQLKSKKSNEEILKAASCLQSEQKTRCTIKIVDNHIWLGIVKKHQKLHSPNLHLELMKSDESKLQINAKFGPDPSLWTLFMFLHFGLALASITLMVVAYANYTLQKNFVFQLVFLLLIVVIWIGLYVFARVNRSKGKGQAKMLLQIAKEIL